jgi:hypothetical protein
MMADIAFFAFCAFLLVAAFFPLIDDKEAR